MNEEIKEILDSIKYHIEEDDWFEIEGHFLKPLYDYITNLQQENEKLQERFDSLMEAHKICDEENERLQQENERKERLITQYGEGMCAYANRIDKAVEYIKDRFDEDKGIWIIDCYDLLNILQNGSDSQ